MLFRSYLKIPSKNLNFNFHGFCKENPIKPISPFLNIKNPERADSDFPFKLYHFTLFICKNKVKNEEKSLDEDLNSIFDENNDFILENTDESNNSFFEFSAKIPIGTQQQKASLENLMKSLEIACSLAGNHLLFFNRQEDPDRVSEKLSKYGFLLKQKNQKFENDFFYKIEPSIVLENSSLNFLKIEVVSLGSVVSNFDLNLHSFVQ